MPWVYEHTTARNGSNKSVITNLRYISLVLSNCGPTGQGADSNRKGVRTPAVRVVMSALARRCKYEQLECYPSLEVIAADTGLDKNTVMLAIKAAEAQGWLFVKKGPRPARRKKVGRKAPNQYRLCLPNRLSTDVSKVLKGYVRHYWETRTQLPANSYARYRGSGSQYLPQSDNALSD